MDMIQTLLITTVIFLVIVGAYFLFTTPSVGKSQKRRLESLRYRYSDSEDTKVESQLKKAIAARRPKAHKVAGAGSRIEALEMRLERTGKGWSLSNYIYASIGLTLAIAVLVFLQSGSPLMSLGVGAVIGLGLPHMVVGFLIKRRTNEFVAKFPDGIELLVRGLRSGLPVAETLQVVAEEIPGPVGLEFKGIVERIKIGKTMEDSLQDAGDKLGIPEFNFFTITLAIQRETGGNLAETLSNLADVLRKRSQMKLKIKAMSSESKASAYIVGSLPFIVFGLIYWISPDYLGQFFVDDRLIVAGLGGLIWMSIGAFIMAKMVSFEI